MTIVLCVRRWQQSLSFLVVCFTETQTKLEIEKSVIGENKKDLTNTRSELLFCTKFKVKPHTFPAKKMCQKSYRTSQQRDGTHIV